MCDSFQLRKQTSGTEITAKKKSGADSLRLYGKSLLVHYNLW